MLEMLEPKPGLRRNGRPLQQDHWINGQLVCFEDAGFDGLAASILERRHQ